ncbi:hypothetical protein [Lentilactobacillus hilgardii]
MKKNVCWAFTLKRLHDIVAVLNKEAHVDRYYSIRRHHGGRLMNIIVD